MEPIEASLKVLLKASAVYVPLMIGEIAIGCACVERAIDRFSDLRSAGSKTSLKRCLAGLKAGLSGLDPLEIALPCEEYIEVKIFVDQLDNIGGSARITVDRSTVKVRFTGLANRIGKF